MASQIHIDGYLVDDKGTWTVRARFADTIDGKRSLHSKSTGLKVKGNNKRKAEAMMRDIVSEWERQANNARPADNPKMRDCIAKWLEQKRLTIRPNTLVSYNVAAKAHIIPELGDIGICDIIHIRNTVTEYSGVIYEAETTKTKAGCRDLYLIQSTTEYLASLQQKQKASRIYGEKVCVYSDGRTVKPEYITRASKRFLTACGYDDIRLHDLRATAATILAKRVPIKQVKEYLGHEDVHTTLTYYDHVLNEDGIATSNAMDNFLTGAGFSSACSENCSESGEADTDKVIFIDAILPKKLVVT